MIIQLSLRHVIRDRHRTFVTTLAMAFACAMMIIFACLMEGVIQGSERNIVTMNTGDIQIHSQGYREDPDIYNHIEHSAEVVALLRNNGYTASERLFASGLLASDQSSSGVQLRGIDLDFENTVTDIHRHVMAGKWLDSADHYGVVIGKKLARLLDVHLGSDVVFIGQTADGYMANDIFHIRGILKSVSASIDTAGVLMSNNTLQQLINLPADAHEIIVRQVDQGKNLEAATAHIKTLISTDLEILNWQQLLPIIYQFLETARVQTMIMLIFTYIAVGSVVLNAMLMSVFERIHQFGIMKALGVTPWQLVGLVYVESMIQTVLASVLGGMMGVSIAWYLQRHGLDMSSLSDGFSFAGLALDPIWYAAISIKSVAWPIVFLFVMAALAVIYPVTKAAVIRPVDAIHHH